MRNIFIELTEEFNAGRLRVIICSGQAVVLHKLAIMSKDGDWIVKEDEEALHHVLSVLEGRNARYRFGGPLDTRWMAGGWSAHFEFQDTFRVRTDLITRPPRIDTATLRRIWEEQHHRELPYLDAPELAEMKKTNREKDYVVIGELGRIMKNPADQLLYSRSARDLLKLASAHPELPGRLADRRPLLLELGKGEEDVARLLDEERRELIRRNEERLKRRIQASEEWIQRWPAVTRRIEGLPLSQAHQVIIESALGILPQHLEDSANG